MKPLFSARRAEQSKEGSAAVLIHQPHEARSEMSGVPRSKPASFWHAEILKCGGQPAQSSPSARGTGGTSSKSPRVAAASLPKGSIKAADLNAKGLHATVRWLHKAGHEGRAQCVTANGSLDHMVSGGADGTVRIWIYEEVSKSYILDSIVLHYSDDSSEPASESNDAELGMVAKLSTVVADASETIGLSKPLRNNSRDQENRCGVTAVHYCHSKQPYISGDTVKITHDVDFLKDRIDLHDVEKKDEAMWDDKILDYLAGQKFRVVRLEARTVTIAPYVKEPTYGAADAASRNKMLTLPRECVIPVNARRPIDGPIISGTSSGDVTVICMEQQVLMHLPRKHKSAVNSISALPLQDDEEAGGILKYLILTTGNDGYAHLFEMECTEAQTHHASKVGVARNRRSMLMDGGIFPQAAYQPIGQDVDRKEDSEKAGEERSKPHMLKCVRKESVEMNHNVNMSMIPVLTGKLIGSNFTFSGGRDDAASIATLTAKEGVWLWTQKGDCLMKLHMHHHVPVYAPSTTSGEHGQETSVEPSISRYTEMAVTMNANGNLIFATGKRKGSTDSVEDEAEDADEETGENESWVAVWYVNDGRVLDTLTKRERQRENWEKALKKYKEDERMAVKPITAYRFGCKTRLTAADKDPKATGFVVDMRGDFRATLWEFEGCSPGNLAMNAPTPATLLKMSGYQGKDMELDHKSKVTALDLKRTKEGPWLLTACEDGTVLCWDLEGSDKGQVVAEVRSLSYSEIILPPVLRLITTFQVLSFAFGPRIPGVKPEIRKDLHDCTTGDFAVPLVKAQFHVEIPNAAVFWVKTEVLRVIMLLFILFALSGAPELCTAALRNLEMNESYKTETVKDHRFGPMRFLHRLVRGMQGFINLFIKLCTTVLVVPIANALANAVDCTHDDTGFNDYGRAPCFLSGDCFLEKANTITCYRNEHLKLVLTMVVLVPMYFFLLVPYAVCSGDAKYVPRSTLYDFNIWEEDNMWRKAAVRKATSIYLGILHPDPKFAFATLLFELVFTTMLPVINILCSHFPKSQMVLLFLANVLAVLKSTFLPPFKSGRYNLIVRSLEVTILNASLCGLIMAFMDEDSNIPFYYFSASFMIVLVMVVVQLLHVDPATEVVHVYETPAY
eukprot:TRINITY_DN4894_c0_g1_i1.p1 TRINITY_DN4894_c0_g1~~TRINITY_DN4894_c0_g1_i1.p1  ORF type:complete len:1129 (-),score=170.42 TRINITY_DN4894_c0_g1_i1:178-3564(-)